MPELDQFVLEIQKLAQELTLSPASRTDTAKLKHKLVAIQDACQYSFTAIRQINRTLPQ